MSWIRVECSGGARYVAPSFSQPPALEGFDKLFASPELSLHRIQCYSVRGTAAGVGACTEVVSVAFGQCYLGGRLGTATMAVGAGGIPGAFSKDERTHTYLEQLLRYVEEVLRSTDDAGAQALLDAVCTRAVVVPAAVPREEETEWDGLSGKRPVRDVDGVGDQESWKNRDFLRQVQPLFRAESGSAGETDRESGSTSASSASRLSSSPAVSFLVPPVCVDECDWPVTLPRPLSQADSVRRQVYLYFTTLFAVPLSLLFSRSNASAVVIGANGKRLSTKASAPPRRSHRSRSADADSSGKRRTSSASAVRPSADAAPAIPQGASIAYTSGATAYVALDRKLTHDESSGSYWRRYAPAASACAAAVQRMMQRLLVAAFPSGLESIFEYSMWVAEDVPTPPVSGQPAATTVPTANAPVPPTVLLPAGVPETLSSPSLRVFAAAFSPSGLVVSSPAFWSCLSHGDRFKLSAAAVDTMMRGCTATPASLLQVEAFPLLLVGQRGPMTTTTVPMAAAVVDVVVCAVGDAMAFVFGFPRERAGSEGAAGESHLLKAEYLTTYLAALRLAVLRFIQQSPATPPSTAAHLGPLLESATRVCVSSTRPHTSQFLHDVFAVASRTLEDFLQGVAVERGGPAEPQQLYDVGGGNTPRILTPLQTRNSMTAAARGAATMSSSDLLVNSRGSGRAAPGMTSSSALAAPAAHPRYPQHAYRDWTATPSSENGGSAAVDASSAPPHAQHSEVQPEHSVVEATAATATAQSAAPKDKAGKTGWRGVLSLKSLTGKHKRESALQHPVADSPGREGVTGVTAVPVSDSHSAADGPAGPTHSVSVDPRAHFGTADFPAQGTSATAVTPSPQQQEDELLLLLHRWGIPCAQPQPQAGGDASWRQRELQLLRDSLPPLLEAFFSLCYTAAVLTQGELNASRSLCGTAVHAFFSVASEREETAAVKQQPHPELGPAVVPTCESSTRGKYVLGCFRGPLQDRTTTTSTMHDATQLCQLFMQAAPLSSPSASVKNTMLLPSYVLDLDAVSGHAPDEADSGDDDDAWMEDEWDGASPPEAERHTLTCFSESCATHVVRPIATEGRARRVLHQREVLVSLEGNHLGSAAMLHTLLETQRTPDAEGSSDDHTDKARQETMRRMCQKLQPWLRAAAAVMEGALGAS